MSMNGITHIKIDEFEEKWLTINSMFGQILDKTKA